MHQKKALVTGASEGIGREFCVRLAEMGYGVTAVARNEDRLKSLVNGLPGVGHAYLIADLSSRDGTQRLADSLIKEKFSLLINNAGFGLTGNFAELPFEKWDAMIGLNIRCLVELSHTFMKRAERGDALINVSSTLSFLAMPAQGVYSATKAFVTSFTESLWFENRKRGVYVQNLCPGATKTNFMARSGGREEMQPAFITQTPEQVVKISLRALRARRGPTVVCGGKNRLFAFVPRILPRKAIISIMGSIRQ